MTAALHEQIDRMARAARRHLRYEREKAIAWVRQYPLRPLSPFSVRLAKAFYDSDQFTINVTRDYIEPVQWASPTVSKPLKRLEFPYSV